MCARNETMMGLGLMLVLVGSLSPVQAEERRTQANGDVTVTATSEEDVACAECPDGATGTKICYQVTLDDDAANDYAKDFHIQVSDGFEANYKCKEVHEFVNGQWVERSWSFAYASQMEGEVRRHYISWYGSPTFRRGETWRFCFVYCGPTNNLDNTIEWTLTNDGSSKPAVPDDDGNRSDVPDSGDNDDPGWSGTKTTAAGSTVGFALVACIMPDGTCQDDVASFECLLSDGEPQGDGSICGEQVCTADLDGTGTVNAADLAILLGSWGPCTQCVADFNGDGVVNAADLAVLLGSWGECPQSAVCGDGVVGEGEQCDPPDGVTCDADCQIITGACDYPDIRTIVADADLDPPDIQQNYDAINATLHLFGGMTFYSLFFEPLDMLSSVALERVETLETCAGVPIDATMVAAALEQIGGLGIGLPLAEVVSSPPGTLEEIKAAIDQLRMQGIGFPPVATSDADAELKLVSILVLVDEAGVLEYGDYFFKDDSEVTEAQLAAITQANDEGGVLDFQVIDVENMTLKRIVRNDHCCNRGGCQALPSLDQCDVMTGRWCGLPHVPDDENCGRCSIGSGRCP